jgi:hypothetical protein
MAQRYPAQAAGLACRLPCLFACLLPFVLGACSGTVIEAPGGAGAPRPTGGNPGAGGSSGGSGFSPTGEPTLPPPGAGPAVMPPAVPPPPASDDGVFFGSAVRRLTKAELRQTLIDLTGLDLGTELAKFPEDFAEAGDVFAFDNKYTHQAPSAALIEAAKNLADTVGAEVLADPAVQKRIVPCTPTGPDDQACLRKFFETFGRRVLRRPLGTDEIERYVTAFAPFAVETKDFGRAVHLGVRALLQDVEFLYRPEVGQPVTGKSGLFKLTGPEVATRLSYLLWGTSPDDALMADALNGSKLGTPEAIRATAMKMMADPRAKRGVQRFHALWLGWERQPPPAALSASMLGETSALIEKVIFGERRAWTDLFKSTETFVDAPLAAHYGLPAPAGGAGWTSYGQTGRQGLLSHGTFLGVERKHADTSPTMRGQFLRTRMLCQAVPPPPPELMVDVDAAPTEGNCKSDRYSMWKREGCKGCHMLMDPLGFGLENYDRVGKRRDVAPGDEGKTACSISGSGEMGGNAFQGVAGLSDELVDSGVLESCLSTQLASFMLGRSPRDQEVDLFARVGQRFSSAGRHFDDLLLDMVSLPGFGYRLAE